MSKVMSWVAFKNPLLLLFYFFGGKAFVRTKKVSSENVSICYLYYKFGWRIFYAPKTPGHGRLALALALAAIHRIIFAAFWIWEDFLIFKTNSFFLAILFWKWLLLLRRCNISKLVQINLTLLFYFIFRKILTGIR